jgi:uncharacterized protein (TIGR03067 family)
MIRLSLLFGSMLAATCAAQDKQDKKEAPKDTTAPFQGTWKLLKAEVNGKEADGGTPTDVRFTFTGNKVSIQKGKDTPETGTYTVDPKKEPNEIDLVGGPKNEKSLGIYKFDKDGKLTVSFVKKPDAVRPKKFGEPDAAVIVLEKVKE